MIDLRRFTLTGIITHGYLGMRDSTLELLELASNEAVNVCRNGRAFIEFMDKSILFSKLFRNPKSFQLSLKILFGNEGLINFGTIRYGYPVRRSQYSELQWSSNTWLIEAREPPVTVEGLKVRVDIDVTVFGIH